MGSGMGLFLRGRRRLLKALDWGTMCIAMFERAGCEFSFLFFLSFDQWLMNLLSLAFCSSFIHTLSLPVYHAARLFFFSRLQSVHIARVVYICMCKPVAEQGGSDAMCNNLKSVLVSISFWSWRFFMYRDETFSSHRETGGGGLLPSSHVLKRYQQDIQETPKRLANANAPCNSTSQIPKQIPS
jgi:hypothetical protein